MQTVDLTQFANSSGWTIKHCEDGLYRIVSEKGRMMRGAFTHKKMAESALGKYLADVNKTQVNTKGMKYNRGNS